MKIGLVAGFGEPIGQVDLARIAGWKFDCVRQDVHLGTNAVPLIAEFVGHSLFPIFITRFPDVEHVVTNALLLLGQRFAVELYDPADVDSEPNGLIPVEQFTVGVAEGFRQARALGFRGDVISGGVSNVDKGALTYLARAVLNMPLEVIVGVHRYSPGGREWSDAHFSSRQEEWILLRDVLAGRRYALTEFGYDGAVHTSAWWKFWQRDWQRSDVEVGFDVVREFAYWKERDAAYCCLYQLRDGPGDSAIDRYGVTHADGTEKSEVISQIARWRT